MEELSNEPAPPPGDDPSAEMETSPEDDRPLDALNLLPMLMERAPEDFVKKMAAGVVTSAKDDDDSRSDYMERYAKQLKLYAGIVKPLGYPAQGAKAPHIAIATKAGLHIWSRIYDQVVPAKGDILKTHPLGPQDRPRTMRVERHMNWQLRHQMPDWGTGHMFSIMRWLFGSTFRYYRWDPIAHTHVIEGLPIDDVIISYTENDVSPQMRNVERITVVRRLARWELEKYQDEKYYSNVDAIFPKSGEDDGSTTDGDVLPATNSDTSSVRVAADDIQGVTAPTKKGPLSKREIYEQHTWLKFPNKLGDGEPIGIEGQTLPVVITVDKQTKKPIGVTLRQEPDPVDQSRYNEEKKAYDIAMKSAGQPQIPGAPPPKPPVLPRPVRMQTVYRVIHFGLFPNPDGFYRLGPMSLLAASNELANTLAAEYMLSAKFHNMNTGWMAEGTREKRGDVQIGHGKIIETRLSPEELDKGIKMLDTKPPADGLMRVVEKLEQNSEIVANADILSGEKGASNETAKGMMIRNSNAQALISVMTRVYLDALSYELKLVAHGNAIYLDETEYFPFTQDIEGQPGQQEVIRQEIGRADYVEDVHIEFTADSRMISKPERVADAKDYLQMILNSPLSQNMLLIDFAFREMFTVAEAPQYIAAMGKPPEPEKPPEPMSQEDENAGFFNEQLHPVLPDDDHGEHLDKIQALKESPLFEKLSSTGKQMLDKHERAHFGHYYLGLQKLSAQTGLNLHALVQPGGAGGVEGGSAGGEAPGGAGAEPQNGPPSPSNGGPVGPA
jgi:hypothetical protein